MKKNINFLIVFLLSVVLFASCDEPEGTLYTGEGNKVSFFNSTLNLNMTDGTLEVPIGRTSSGGEFAVPVTLSAAGAGYEDVFQVVNSPVSFNSGEAKAYVNISYSDFSIIDPSALSISLNGMDVNVGLAFPFTLKFDNDIVSPSIKDSVNVLASNALAFEAFGEATLDSRNGWWGGETEEDFLHPDVQKAVGANVYKLVNPFGFHSFAFMIMSDNTVLAPNQLIYDYGPDGYGVVTMTDVSGVYDPEENSVTLTVGAYRVAAGSFGGGTEIIYLP